MTTILILGVLVGAVLGLTGAGGGIFAVPALVFGMGWSMPQATPIALLAVAGAAAVGTLEGLRQGLVRYKAAMLMSATGICVTSLGVMTAHTLPPSVLLLVFAAALVVVAIRMYRGGREIAGTSRDDATRKLPCQMNTETGRLKWTPATAVAVGSVGLVSGFLTGLLGVGGGFVIVPALRQISDISMHSIIATSLAVIALIAGGTVVMVWTHGAVIPSSIALPFLASTAAGMLAGRALAKKLPAAMLQKAFAILMGVVAASFVFKAVTL